MQRPSMPMFGTTSTKHKGIQMDLHENKHIGFYRLKEVLKIIPISRSSWLQGVKDGKYPRPYNLSARTTAWRKEDIIKLVGELSHEQ